MLTFKDAAAGDIDDAFIADTDEFADYHNLNGDTVLCVVEGWTNKEHIQIAKQDIDGLSLDEYVVHVKKCLLPSVPEQGMRFYLDGILTQVKNCDDDMGVLVITLEGHNAGGTTYEY